jgi:hypothetical protein
LLVSFEHLNRIVGREVETREKDRMRHTDKHLANGTTSRKTEDVAPDCWVPGHECKSSCKFTTTTACCAIHSQIIPKTGVYKIRAHSQVADGQESVEDVVGTHHLWTSIALESSEDVILGRVCEAVKKKIDTEKQKTPGAIALNLALLRLTG